MSQLADETVEQSSPQYNYQMVENSEFGNIRSEMIRDCLVIGIHNQQLSEQLQSNTGKGRETYSPKSSNWAAAIEIDEGSS